MEVRSVRVQKLRGRIDIVLLEQEFFGDVQAIATGSDVAAEMASARRRTDRRMVKMMSAGAKAAERAVVVRLDLPQTDSRHQQHDR